MGRFFSSIAISLWLTAGVTSGGTYFVTNTSDTLDSSSLRGAIIAANNRGGTNAIVLGPGRTGTSHGPCVYSLSITGKYYDFTAHSGDLNINRGELTIIGSRPGVTIDATGLGDRVFEVRSHLILKNLTIMGGSPSTEIERRIVIEPNHPPIPLLSTPRGTPTDPRDAVRGGAILNYGVLSLVNCVITNCAAGSPITNTSSLITRMWPAGDGGAIYNYGTLTAWDCVIAGNLAGTVSSNLNGSMPGGSGGGIANLGVCALTGCILGENEAGAGQAGSHGGPGGNGGGLWNLGSATLTRCLIGLNRAGRGCDGRVAYAWPNSLGTGGDGGGIYNSGNLQLDACTVYANKSGDAGTAESLPSMIWATVASKGGSGAGIFNSGSLVMTNCTISGNCCGTGGSALETNILMGGAGGDGGAVFNNGTVRAVSCTIVDNAAGDGGNGGGDCNDDPRYSFATLPYLVDQTLILTQKLGFPLPDPGRGGRGGSGGGIFNAAGERVFLRNTLVALNTSGHGGEGGTNTIYLPDPNPPLFQAADSGDPGYGPDLAGEFGSLGFNLVGIADGSSGCTNGVRADQAGDLFAPIDPLIASLQMNGGAIPTHALLEGSPAIDRGASFRKACDQRGKLRPYNCPAIPDLPWGNASDIGAFEWQP